MDENLLQKRAQTESRDWQLWSMMVFILLLLTAGFLIAHLDDTPESLLSQPFVYFFGLSLFIILFCIYVYKTKLVLNVMNQLLLESLQRKYDRLDKMNQHLTKEVRNYREVQDDLSKLNDYLKRDIAKKEEVEEALRTSRAVFSSIVEQASDAFMVVDKEGVVRFANTAVESIFDKKNTQMVGEKFSLPVLGGPPTELEIIRRGKPIGTAEMRVYSTTWEKEHAYLVACRNVTEQKRLEEQLRHLACYDYLTDLPNRSLFLDRLQQALTRAPWHGRHVAVCYLDIDRFKEINDIWGHRFGDLLLKATGDRLSSCLRAGDTVARIGGDEFALVLADLAREQDVERVAQTIMNAMTTPFIIEGHEFHSGASLGFSISPNDGNDKETLLQHADIALYRAKAAGRGNFQYYSEEMGKGIQSRVQTIKQLRTALLQNEFKLYYQPKLDLSLNRVIGFEALIRWENEELGFVSPNRFIPLAEETGLIVPIGEWVLATACAQCKDWHRAGLSEISIAINISAKQFYQKKIVETVRQALDASGLNPAFLELELTESLMQHLDNAKDILTELTAMGVAIAIDDFGMGFSCLNYLKQLPVSYIKIDQSFIRGVPANEGDMAITMAITSLAHSLNMKVIAEGVERDDQLEFLRVLKCEMIQGYLIGKPAPPETVITYLQEKGLCRV